MVPLHTPGTNRRDYSGRHETMGTIQSIPRRIYRRILGVDATFLPGPIDHAAAQADIADIKHHVLARSDRTLRLVESDVNAAVCEHLDVTRLIRLPIAHLGGAFEARRR